MLTDITGMAACYQTRVFFTRHIMGYFSLKMYNLMYIICMKHRNMGKIVHNCTMYYIIKQLLLCLICNEKQFTIDRNISKSRKNVHLLSKLFSLLNCLLLNSLLQTIFFFNEINVLN